MIFSKKCLQNNDFRFLTKFTSIIRGVCFNPKAWKRKGFPQAHHIKINKKLDVALLWFTTFGYFNEKQNLQVLKNISNHLNKKEIL